MKLLKLIACGGVILILHASAFAKNIVNATEVGRFLTSSGMKKIAVNGHKMTLSLAFRQGLITKASADCFRSDEGVATYVEQALSPLIAKNFKNKEDLKAVNYFNETAIGIGIVKYINIAQDKALASFESGENLPPLTPMQLSPNEKEDIARWESSSHFAGFRQLDAVLRDMRSTPEYQLWLVASKEKCSGN